VRYLFAHFGAVMTHLAEHLALTFTSLGIALAIAVPLGIFVARSRRGGSIALGILGVIYTIPSLALLALLIPLEGLGFWTAVTALAAYAQMILVRNIAAGLGAVDPAQIEAARGLGLSATQRFLRVELPQALPIVLGGLRLATVTLISLATIAAWIDAGGLGTLLFIGITTDDPQKIVAGSVTASALAIIADLMFRRVERLVRV